MAQELPEGTVTVLFTDVEGSTVLAQRLGDKPYHALLTEHSRILREQIARHGGHEVKAVGDGFIEDAGDYFGTAVTLAARIADKAKGGQIMVSEVVRTVIDSLAGVEFRDAGRKQLKGIKGRQRLFEVVWQD